MDRMDEHHYLATIYRDGSATHNLCRDVSTAIVAWLVTMTGRNAGRSPLYTSTLDCVTRWDCPRCNPRY